MATTVFQHVFWWLAKDHPPRLKWGKHRDTDGEMKEKNKEEPAHIDVICIDVVICAFQNDPRGIICRGREKDSMMERLMLAHIWKHKSTERDDRVQSRTRRDVSVAIFGNVLR